MTSRARVHRRAVGGGLGAHEGGDAVSFRRDRNRTSAQLSPWHLLLLIPFPAVLWVPFYNSAEPALFGFPYFYAYQMMWVIITALLTALVYLLTTR